MIMQLHESMSHALRVRGLKHGRFEAKEKEMNVARSTRAWIETLHGVLTLPSHMSHALRVRGLKPEREVWLRCAATVARSTRAWIETGGHALYRRRQSVARSTRAWIETVTLLYPLNISPSHALRVRGLKPYLSLNNSMN